jgi:hypothetical protein
MSRNKPRHNLNKKQNSYGGDGQCSYYDGTTSSGSIICEAGMNHPTCNGNRHNCVKEKYKLLASVPLDNRWKIK